MIQQRDKQQGSSQRACGTNHGRELVLQERGVPTSHFGAKELRPYVICEPALAGIPNSKHIIIFPQNRFSTSDKIVRDPF